MRPVIHPFCRTLYSVQESNPETEFQCSSLFVPFSSRRPSSLWAGGEEGNCRAAADNVNTILQQVRPSATTKSLFPFSLFQTGTIPSGSCTVVFMLAVQSTDGLSTQIRRMTVERIGMSFENVIEKSDSDMKNIQLLNICSTENVGYKFFVFDFFSIKVSYKNKSLDFHYF